MHCFLLNELILVKISELFRDKIIYIAKLQRKLHIQLKDIILYLFKSHVLLGTEGAEYL